MGKLLLFFFTVGEVKNFVFYPPPSTHTLISVLVFWFSKQWHLCLKHKDRSIGNIKVLPKCIPKMVSEPLQAEYD
jgi:hypothetical protein